MNFMDTHCDTLCCLLDEGKQLQKNDCHFSLEQLKSEHHYTQFFACFIDPLYKAGAPERCLALLDRLYEEVEHNRENLSLCTSYEDLYQARREGKTAAFLSLEGGEAITSLVMLRTYHRLGVRLATLTWNHSNHLAAGALEPEKNKGLTEFGKQVIGEMNRLRMVLDVSHLNEASFWDAVSCSSLPVIASHSNAKAVCGHPRNLTDEQFRAIREMGGYVGINFCPYFLREEGEAGMEDIIRHMEHFLALDGEDTIGIGSDFDGIGSLPKGISGVGDMDLIFDKLKELGYSPGLIDKIAHKNLERIIKIF